MKGWLSSESGHCMFISVCAQCATPSDRAARHEMLYNIPRLYSLLLLARLCQCGERINKHSWDKHSRPTPTH